MKTRLVRTIATAALACLASATWAQNVFISELPNNIRFEQYTGAAGNMVFWRLPTPGVSTFPSSSCLHLIIPSDKPEHAARFMALYLYAKSNTKQVFYVYSPTTCLITSFGMDG